MKNKIKHFAKGDFQMEPPEIRFLETHLEITVGEGEVHQGSVTIENQRDGVVRGLVYSSSYRLRVIEQGFEGKLVKVHFTYDSAGLVAGQVETGRLTVVCDGGEYEITFAVVIEKPFIMTSHGKIQSLGEFRQLAKKEFGEARRLFRTRQFYEVLKYEDVRVRNLYDNMRKWALDEQALEEFLIGTKQKEKICLTLSEERVEYQDVLETRREWMEITKSTWGFLPIRIYSDADFIEMGQEELTTEEFVGSTYRLSYLIREEHLHAGKNYGRIFVETPYERRHIEVEVCQHVHKRLSFGAKGLIAGQGLKEYLACISGKLEVDVWVEQALDKVKQLRSIEPDNEYYLLLQAHIYLRGRREEEARWILEHHNLGKFMLGRRLEISAYHMFLKALLKKDVAYTNRVAEELHHLYQKNPQSWELLCMLINLDSRYRGYSERVKLLEKQFHTGANQVLFYAECYLCFQEKVILLRKLDAFEIRVLQFAAKYRILTRELAVYAAELMVHQRSYHPQLVRILEVAYEMYGDTKILQALCMQLIKGNKIGTAYFGWYEKAVQEELKIAQLYEYYMMSVNEKRMKKPFPRSIYLYFMHGINLDTKRKALLYANIMMFEDQHPDIFAHYVEQMEAYTWEQLEKRRINESMRILYTRFLRDRELSREQMEALFDICHAYHVETKQPDIKYVLVIEKDGSVGQRVAYGKEGATVYLYEKESRIVWEARNGVHYTDSISYELKRLFYERHYLTLCKQCKKRWQLEEQMKPDIPVTFDNIRRYGMDVFEEREVFLLCTRRIRENVYEEDEFLLYLSLELLKRGQYDKATLTYLARFYCGATADMKYIWKMAKEYQVKTTELAERIITQMLFSETLFQETDIFVDYYGEKPYFRLKQAYLAYVSRLYVVRERALEETIVQMIWNECDEKEYLAEICKVAILKYYTEHAYETERAEQLQAFLYELCGKQLVFSFYLNYPMEWLQKVQLHDKTLAVYQSKGGSSVRVCYQIGSEEEPVAYEEETLRPVYDNLFVKEWVLFEGEWIHYFFEELQDGVWHKEKKRAKVQPRIAVQEGRYARLNEMLGLQGDAKEQAMEAFVKEERLAEQLFPIY